MAKIYTGEGEATEEYARRLLEQDKDLQIVCINTKPGSFDLYVVPERIFANRPHAADVMSRFKNRLNATAFDVTRATVQFLSSMLPHDPIDGVGRIMELKVNTLTITSRRTFEDILQKTVGKLSS